MPALRTRGADHVLAALEGIGYEVADPCVVGAWAVGAPHKRDRVWIVGRLADAGGVKSNTGYDVDMQRGRPRDSEQAGVGCCCGFGEYAHYSAPELHRPGCPMAEGIGARLEIAREQTARQERQAIERSGGAHRWPSRPGEPQHEWEAPRLAQFEVGEFPDGLSERLVRIVREVSDFDDAQAEAWLRRNHVKIDRAMNRHALKAYGNSIVPQVFAEIARFIVWMDGLDCMGNETNGRPGGERK